MTKSKTEPAVQVAGALLNAVAILSNRVTARGGNLTEALVRLGKGEDRYENSLNNIAGELAWVSGANKQEVEIIAPEGGRVHIVHVLVDESIDWNVAIKAWFPATPSNYSVCKVGNQYPSRTSGKSAEREIILVNFGIDRPNVAAALMWGKEHKLISASPRSVLTLGKHKPNFHVELGQKVLNIVSLEKSTSLGCQRVLGGCWSDNEREARLFWLDLKFSGSLWVAFERDPSA